MTQILADAKIVGVERALAPAGRVRTFTGARPPRTALRDARVLVVRSVTRVDEDLLAQAPDLALVASATAGVDHVDRAALARRAVSFAHAPGANATAVAEYVVAAMLAFGPPVGAKVAVVGFGQTGRRVAMALRRLGYRVAVSDPPLARLRARGGAPSRDAFTRLGWSEDLQPLARALGGAAALTLHVPRVDRGFAPTVRLVDARALSRLAPGALVVNTSRGDVLDLPALSRAGLPCVLDVWPNEPEIDPRWLDRLCLRLATPHVAGYSREAKLRATAMVRRAVLAHAGVRAAPWPEGEPPPAGATRARPGEPPASFLLHATGLAALDRDLRASLHGPAAARGRAFESLRVARRREFAHLSPAGLPPPARALLARLAHLVPWPDPAQVG